MRDVDVYLFDEPLSNLDAQLRVELRVEIKRLHKRLGSTMVYVTHDQVEAMTLADRIAVMRDGVVQQIADPETIYEYPANRFVGGFLGSPGMNFIDGRVKISDGVLTVEAAGQVIALPHYRSSQPMIEEGRPVVLGIRPERLTLGGSDADGDTTLAATVDVYELLGAERVIWAALDEQIIAIRAGVETARISEGAAIRLGFPSASASLFDAETGQRI